MNDDTLPIFRQSDIHFYPLDEVASAGQQRFTAVFWSQLLHASMEHDLVLPRRTDGLKEFEMRLCTTKVLKRYNDPNDEAANANHVSQSERKSTVFR